MQDVSEALHALATLQLMMIVGLRPEINSAILDLRERVFYVGLLVISLILFLWPYPVYAPVSASANSCASLILNTLDLVASAWILWTCFGPKSKRTDLTPPSHPSKTPPAP